MPLHMDFLNYRTALLTLFNKHPGKLIFFQLIV
jgi:hypothetical protein